MSDKYVLVHEDATPELSEHVTSEAVRADKFHIDGNKILGVHLVGFQAKNYMKPNTEPYKYTEEALKAAVPLYKEVDIYVSHPESKGATRSLADKIGFVENPSFKAGVGVVGDLVLNPKHQVYEAFMWWAENKPSKLAMSHVAISRYNAKENAMTEVAKVQSVDFVHEGSTTHSGLFKEGVLADEVMNEKWLAIMLDTAYCAINEIRYPLCCSTEKPLTQAEQAVKIIPVIKDLLDEVSKLAKVSTKESAVKTTETTKEHTMEFADITLDSLRKSRKDLVDVIATEAVQAHIETEEAVTDALAGIPADAQSDTFKTLVREAVVAGNDKRVAELVEDRKALATKTVAVVEAAPAPTRTKTTTSTEAKADSKSIAAQAKRKN